MLLYTKSDFCQLCEWCTLNALKNKGFLPVGECFSLPPAGNRTMRFDYYSPYEVRPMTEAEIAEYNKGRVYKLRVPKKPLKTLLSKFENFYASIEVTESLDYGCIEIKQTLLSNFNYGKGGYELMVTVYSKDGSVLLECLLRTICTRLTKGDCTGIYNDYYNADSLDARYIKSVPDVDDEETAAGLSKLKQILSGTSIIGVRYAVKYPWSEHEAADNVSFRYLDFSEFLKK